MHPILCQRAVKKINTLLFDVNMFIKHIMNNIMISTKFHHCKDC